MIKAIGYIILGIGIGIALTLRFTFCVSRNKDRRIKMFSEYFYSLDKWMKLLRKGCRLEDYLVANDKRIIAIYGIGIMGRQLLQEFCGGKIIVKYVIDQNVDNKSYSFPVRNMEDELENVDLIVVTPSYDFKNIKAELEKKVSCKIISLYQLIGDWYDDCE